MCTFIHPDCRSCWTSIYYVVKFDFSMCIRLNCNVSLSLIHDGRWWCFNFHNFWVFVCLTWLDNYAATFIRWWINETIYVVVAVAIIWHTLKLNVCLACRWCLWIYRETVWNLLGRRVVEHDTTVGTWHPSRSFYDYNKKKILFT